MASSEISVRIAGLNDLSDIKELFVNSIRETCRNDYSKEQIDKWCLSVENTERWRNYILQQYFLVAIMNDKIVGFASLENSGCLHLLYVHCQFQNKGIAGILLAGIEKEAVKKDFSIICSEVSITARPFFEKKGFIVKKEKIKLIGKVEIMNFIMEKKIKKT